MTFSDRKGSGVETGQGRAGGTFLLEYAEKVPSSSVSDSEVDGRGSKWEGEIGRCVGGGVGVRVAMRDVRWW